MNKTCTNAGGQPEGSEPMIEQLADAYRKWERTADSPEVDRLRRRVEALLKQAEDVRATD